MDRGGEHLSKDFTDHLALQGTVRSLMVHDTPEENGVSEHLNLTIVTKAHAMKIGAGLPKFLWTEALQHATWIKSRLATQALDGKTPYEMLYGEKHNLAGLPQWG